jgi:hypothetical protein
MLERKYGEMPKKEGEMPTYFIKDTDAEGNEVYREVEADEIVKSHDLYKQVKSEAISNRHTAKELRDKYEKLTEQPPTPTVDPAQIRDEILQSVLSTINEERTKEQQREATVNELMTKHKLPANLRGVLNSHPNPESLAVELERANVQVAEDAPNPAPVNTVSDVMSRVDKILGLTDSQE